MQRHHVVPWYLGLVAILALVAVFALGHYFTYRNLPKLAVQPMPGMTLQDTCRLTLPVPAPDPVLVAAQNLRRGDGPPLWAPSHKWWQERMASHRPASSARQSRSRPE